MPFIPAQHFDLLRSEYRMVIDALHSGMYLCGNTETQILAKIAELDRTQYGV